MLFSAFSLMLLCLVATASSQRLEILDEDSDEEIVHDTTLSADSLGHSSPQPTGGRAVKTEPLFRSATPPEGTREEFSDIGSIWLSGSMGYGSTRVGDFGARMISIAPSAHFFPSKHFAIGPTVKWTGVFQEEWSSSNFSLGTTLGFVHHTYKSPTFYVLGGAQFDIFAMSFSEGGGGSAAGFTLPFVAGMVIPLNDILGLQIQPSYQITAIENAAIHTFSVALGFCAMSKKMCVSSMQTISFGSGM